MKRLILGSGSPRRRELLAGLNLDFTVDKENNFDEGPEPGVDARRIPLDMLWASPSASTVRSVPTRSC